MKAATGRRKHLETRGGREEGNMERTREKQEESRDAGGKQEGSQGSVCMIC